MIEQQLEEILQKTLDCKVLKVTNDSHLHASHASSPHSGDSHFSVLIVSDDFVNLTKIKRHSLVNQAVKSLFDRGLHALSLRTMTAEEYDSII